jgi:prolyl-tRNA editing enzyme YbaK/EbsC (Cys-tRNA(Pro) deacylase)
MAASTRTAEDAAAACGCAVAQIVKSLVFRGQESGRPYLMLVSGSNRLNEKSVGALLGEKLTRPDADYVREVTGFAIGGVPPLGHSAPMQVFMDEDLLRFETVWAAAGTPRAVFAVAPGALADAVGATIMKVTG